MHFFGRSAGVCELGIRKWADVWSKIQFGRTIERKRITNDPIKIKYSHLNFKYLEVIYLKNSSKILFFIHQT